MPVVSRQPALSSHASPSVLTVIGRWISSRVRVAVWHGRAYLTTHATFYRLLFGVLRAVRPVFIAGKVVVVTRHEDIKAVLSRDVDFTLAEYAEERMLSGSFLLNIDWPEQHAYEESKLLKALRGPDRDPCRRARQIRDIAVKRCQRVICEARQADNEIDVAGQLAERVALDVVEKYFGVPPPDDDHARMADWLRDLASAILLLPPKGSKDRYRIERSAEKLCEFMTDLIRKRTCEIEKTQTGSDTELLDDDDVLTRLLKLTVVGKSQCREKRNAQDWVRRYISGLIAFGNATIVRTAADAIDEILKRPRVLADAASTARDLNQALDYSEKIRRSSSLTGAMEDRQRKAADDNLYNLRKSLKQYVYEALRFRPMLPVLFRYCPRMTMIAAEQLRGRRIPAGAIVVAPPIAGMFDRRVFLSPYQFRVDRPLKDYLLFGAGMHACIGQYVADIELVEIVRAVLVLPGLRHAPGDRGRIYYEGPAAKHLRLKFDDESIGSEINSGNK